MRNTTILAAAALISFGPLAHAALDVDSASFTYSESFDSLAASGSTTWFNDGTLAGWSLFNSTGAAVTTYAADNGASNAGAFKSLGSDSDRALGGVGSGGSYFGSPASGTVAGWIALALQNNSGLAITAVTLGFDGEQWRNGGNTSAQPMVLEVGFGAGFADVGTWTALGGSFDWASPVTGAGSGAVDGNGAGLVSGVGGSFATDWAAGDTLWLRWTERNDFGNDHGLAIDNLALTVTAVPEPGTYAMLLSGLLAIGAFVRRRG